VINFVSNLPKDLRSGGFSAMNARAFSAINRVETSRYVGPINPPAILWQKALSKFRRVAGSQGAFFFFSERRLETIAGEVHSKCQADARLDFFHGFTPWILTRPQRPYIAWSDCTFRDYIDIFHCQEEFVSDDLERIKQAEAAWLRNASRVFFTSNWAAERAVRDYDLDANRVRSVGIFGEIDMPARDAYAGRKEFAFVSTNFDAKGGRLVLAAFRDVRKRHPDAALIIVGDQPSDLGPEAGVTFAGFLRKEIPDEYRRFQQILGGVRALVNATTNDICPLVLVEAGYVGCPAISTRKFAIPEIIDHGRTGLLLDDSSQPDAVACAMNWMLEHANEYQLMREAAWAKARGQHSRVQFEERLHSYLSEGISDARMLAQ
jgi:glycosyltransferase involved in cell wall biosynthesis